MDEIGRGGGPRNHGRGRVRGAAIGCGILLVVVLALLASIVLRSSAGSDGGVLGSLVELLRTTAADRDAMARLREDLGSRYSSEDIGIHTRARAGSGPGKANLALDVEFLNPRFVTVPEEPQSAQLAHDIALYVASTYPDVERFDIISITLIANSGTGITQGISATYRFEVTDLLRPTEAPQ